MTTILFHFVWSAASWLSGVRVPAAAAAAPAAAGAARPAYQTRGPVLVLRRGLRHDLVLDAGLAGVRQRGRPFADLGCHRSFHPRINFAYCGRNKMRRLRPNCYFYFEAVLLFQYPATFRSPC